MKYTIDAKGKRLGRVASEAATFLMGKNRVQYVRHYILPVTVEIINTASLSIPQKKYKNKIYTRYTGYPSGLRKEPLEAIIKKHGITEPVKRAVYGMLPANKLRKERMRRLVIHE